MLAVVGFWGEWMGFGSSRTLDGMFKTTLPRPSSAEQEIKFNNPLFLHFGSICGQPFSYVISL